MWFPPLHADIGQQQRDLFLYISKNSIVLDITWAKIADVLETHMKMGNLTKNIREKFQLQASYQGDI